MANLITRKYSYSDDAELERARLFADLVGVDLALFTAKFPFIVAAYRTQFIADIDAADAWPKDDQVVTQLEVKTESLVEAMSRGNDALSDLNDYAHIAFKDFPKKERAFGQDTWVEKKRKALSMSEALEHGYNIANHVDYKATLIARGFLQANIDNLLAISNEIQTKNGLQEVDKSNRPAVSQARIKLHNLVWDKMDIFSTAAQVVFRQDAARQQQYQLYPSGWSNAITYVNITNTKTGNPLADVEVAPDSGMASQLSGIDGVAHFQSVNMPDLLEGIATHAVEGTRNFSFAVTEGETNNFTIVW